MCSLCIDTYSHLDYYFMTFTIHSPLHYILLFLWSIFMPMWLLCHGCISDMSIVASHVTTQLSKGHFHMEHSGWSARAWSLAKIVYQRSKKVLGIGETRTWCIHSFTNQPYFIPMCTQGKLPPPPRPIYTVKMFGLFWPFRCCLSCCFFVNETTLGGCYQMFFAV